MIRFIITCIFIYFLAIFQTTMISSIAMDKVKPDLLFIATISISILYGPVIGLLSGLGIGSLVDILSGRTGSFCAIIFAVLAFLSGMLEKRVFKENIFIPAGIIMVGSMVKEIFFYFINFSWAGEFSLKYIILNIILLKSVYNLILTPFIFLIIKFIILPKDRFKVREGI